MAAIRVLVADDEPLARRRIVRLARAERDVEVVAECASGAEALAACAPAAWTWRCSTCRCPT
jgi:DNA-binding NarL/FixJ family response regulator